MSNSSPDHKKITEAIIHIGIHKTGTTTLQQFFYGNRDVLSSQSILYPDFGARDHRHMVIYAGGNHRRFMFHRSMGLTNDKRLENFRKQFENTCSTMIRASNCKRLLLSHENFSFFDIEEIQNLKNLLDPYVCKYKVIVYLRPQHEFALSEYSTHLVLGGQPKNIFDAQDPRFYKFEEILNSWEAIFGKDQIHPKIFHRSEFPEGDIKYDFLKTIRVNSKEFKEVPDVQIKINAEAQFFLEKINPFLPPVINERPNPFRANIANLVSRKRQGKGLLPSRNEVENFFQLFQAENKRIKDKWFPEKDILFDVSFDHYPNQQQSFDNEDWTFVFEIFAELWTTQQKKINALKKEIESLKNLNSSSRKN